jgi:hypothetical protein
LQLTPKGLLIKKLLLNKGGPVAGAKHINPRGACIRNQKQPKVPEKKFRQKQIKKNEKQEKPTKQMPRRHKQITSSQREKEKDKKG